MVSCRARGGTVDLQGQTVSHYRVLRKLGGGGMGVVYEAEDLRLRRHVALKFLPESLAHDQDALQRFMREARAASSLNHPNICTIYEVEEHEGRPVIVMELMQGSTLKQRLAEGPLPVDQVLELSAEISDGLEAAHAQGIIHRDIKPANIFLTSRGTAKILDFGLAKLLPEGRLSGCRDPVDEESDLSLTIPGVIHGTTCYMSPEQARGEELDARTDLFSLGAVMYEMATGERAFAGKNVVLTLDAVLNKKPRPVSKVTPGVPAGLEAIIDKALDKHREQRYQTAAELASDLHRLEQDQESEARLLVSDQRRRLTTNISSRGAPSATRNFRVARHWRLVLPAALALAMVLGGVLLLQSRRANKLSEKDTIVLADFENKTGDPVFDDTLKQALAVDLGQSAFLNILSDQGMASTLRLMGRAPDQPVVGDVAREVCVRTGSKAMLGGTISKLGDEFIVGLNAINCATGDVLVKELAEAHRKEEVLKALGTATTDMRAKLGESLASVQKFATPVEEATTSSLEALKAYSTGRRVGAQNGNAADIPHYQRAIELDPNFALAYRALGFSYRNLGQNTRAVENARKAFELRERVSERERYGIEAYYYSVVTGNLDKANQVYELWKQTYPRDVLPSGDLGDNDMRVGQWQRALQETLDCIRLDPNYSVFISNLAEAQLALNTVDEARTTIERARARGLDSFLLRVNYYQVAFLRGDAAGMQQQLAWAAGRSREEDWLLATQSDTEAYFGQLAKAREYSQRAVDSAGRADEAETAALWHTDAALHEAELDNASAARQNAAAALGLVAGSTDVSSMAALALARAGDTGHAQKLADRLDKEFPENTMLRNYWLPSIRAANELARKHADKAIEILKTAAPYELGQSEPFQLGMMYPIYLRGEAYLLKRKGKEAELEFQKIIDHRGIVLNFPLGALAHVGLARAYALQGNAAGARTAYQDFFALWKDADPDVPILQQAKAEYAKLK